MVLTRGLLEGGRRGCSQPRIPGSLMGLLAGGFSSFPRGLELLESMAAGERERSIFYNPISEVTYDHMLHCTGHTDQCGRGQQKNVNMGGGVIKSHLRDWLPQGRNQRG